LSTGGRYLISGSRDYSIKIWDLLEKKCIEHLTKAHDCKRRLLALIFSGYVQDIQIAHGNTYFVSGSWDRSIKLWDFESAKLIYAFEDAHSGSSG
jgi:FOG: WD40 repeat